MSQLSLQVVGSLAFSVCMVVFSRYQCTIEERIFSAEIHKR